MYDQVYRTYLGTGVDSPVVLWQNVHIMEDKAGEVAPKPPRLGHAGVHEGGAVEGPRVRLLHDKHPEVHRTKLYTSELHYQ